MMEGMSLPTLRLVRLFDWPRIGYAASIALYGGAMGFTIVVVNLLTRTPIFKEPERLPLVPEVFIASGGALAGVFLAAPIAYLLYGERPVLSRGPRRKPLGIFGWSALGLGFGVFQPLLAGGLFIPFSRLFLGLYESVVSPGDMLTASIDIVLLSPIRVVTTGGPLLLTALIAAPFFAGGAWVIDRVNASRSHGVSSYGAWAAAILLGLIAVGVAAFGPAELLAKLG